MDKQKQIEEMAKERAEIQELMRLLDYCVVVNPMNRSEIATFIYGNNYRKIPKNAVVIPIKEFNENYVLIDTLILAKEELEFTKRQLEKLKNELGGE